ncbi:MAG: DUF6585 family protein [Isosphaerales bacterium]
MSLDAGDSAALNHGAENTIVAAQGHFSSGASAPDHGLGECIAVSSAQRGIVIGGFALAILCCGMTALGVGAAFVISGRPGQDPRLVFGSLLPASALLLAGSAYLFHQVSRLDSMEVFLHSGGLAIRRGGHFSVIPWDQIETVWHREKVVPGFESLVVTWIGGDQSVYTLQTRGGERFILNTHFRGLETLGKAIRRETTPRLLAPAVKTYQVEGKVEFGKLAVGREGLCKGGKTLPWSEVGSVVVENGCVFVKKRNGRLAWVVGMTMETIPNLYVYLALVQSILKTQEKGRRDEN